MVRLSGSDLDGRRLLGADQPKCAYRDDPFAYPRG